MQAIILAAGMGKRLKEHTVNHTKCMVPVNGVTLIERMMTQLDKLGLSRIVLVAGYKKEALVDFVSNLAIKTPVQYVTNEIYDQTNNIYSLFLAREHLMSEDTLLLESDLIFEEAVLKRIFENPAPNLALVTKYENWMDGTLVTLKPDKTLASFISRDAFCPADRNSYYKTVNIYKFSQDFSANHYVPFLEAYTRSMGNQHYYEQVLKGMVLLGNSDLKAEVLSGESWYEIDDAQDLDIAETRFTDNPAEKKDKIANRYGGYWRYPEMIDFCYLVNPYFPPKTMKEEIKASFDDLVCSYPSSKTIASALAADLFNLQQDTLAVGNGACELIDLIMNNLKGTLGLIRPIFEEYPNRKNKEDLIVFHPANQDYAYCADDLIAFFTDKPITSLLLVNPDNPSGNYLLKADVIKLADWAESKNLTLVLDESFVDFVDAEENGSLLDREILSRYPNMIVIKSLSKSYGIPGFRLGIAASENRALMAAIRNQLPIWNLNAFAEFFLQIMGKYQTDYSQSTKKLAETRKDLERNLAALPQLRVITSQANYMMCELQNGCTAAMLAEQLLDQHNILIKDLTPKKGIRSQNLIRIAVKDSTENQALIDALGTILPTD